MIRFKDHDLDGYERRLRALLDDIDQIRRQLRAADTGVTLQTRRASVSRALQRIPEHTFGRCVSCGGEVETHRLEERPDAERCTRCEIAATTT